MYMDLSTSYSSRIQLKEGIALPILDESSCYSPLLGVDSPVLPLSASPTDYYTGSSGHATAPPSVSHSSGGVRLSPSEFNSRFSPHAEKRFRLEGKGDMIRKRLQYVGMIDDPIVVSDTFVSQPCTPVRKTKEWKETKDMYDQTKTPMRLQYRLKQQCGHRKPFLLRSPVRSLRNVEIMRNGKLSTYFDRFLT